ncbi:MAG: substrate-binding domain-containing protein [Hespellia sp.]|nr:substrate-binding domain-containing protein [Hespellia sp.]
MKRAGLWCCVVVSGLLLGISGCGNSQQAGEKVKVEGLDKLGDMEVVTREEGSGTRSVFAQIVGFEGTKGDSQQSDLTTKKAVVKENAEEVMDEVASNPSAIGYVSKGTLYDLDGVKSLSIEGTSADDDSGRYSLSRDFSLAYSSELSELEQDFLTYVHGAGQKIVGNSYETVAKESTFLSNQAAGTITIEGSTSVAPLMEDLVAAYQKINTNAKITVTATDSSQGLTNAMSGTCDFGMASRDLKDYEKELLDYEVIAKDNIVVIVGKDNPLTDISLDELKAIYTGEVTKWNELNEM